MFCGALLERTFSVRRAWGRRWNGRGEHLRIPHAVTWCRRGMSTTFSRRWNANVRVARRVIPTRRRPPRVRYYVYFAKSDNVFHVVGTRGRPGRIRGGPWEIKQGRMSFPGIISQQFSRFVLQATGRQGGDAELSWNKNIHFISGSVTQKAVLCRLFRLERVSPQVRLGNVDVDIESDEELSQQ